MILVFLLVIPLIASAACLWWGRGLSHVPRWIALGALMLQAVFALVLWIAAPSSATPESWYATAQAPWIPLMGVSFYLAADGLSAAMVGLSAFIGLIALGTAWNTPRQTSGTFLGLLLASLSGIMGAFLAEDLFLFFVFYELMLLPIFLLLMLEGAPATSAAAKRFFIFTQGSGLFLLIAFAGLAWGAGTPNGPAFSFDALIGAGGGTGPGVALLAALLIAFAVKLPLFPLHRWQPGLYETAPVPAAIVISGLMSKVGAYGMLRFGAELLPEAVPKVAPFLMLAGIVTIFYGAALAYSQSDLRRLLAYSSMSHLGFVALGVLSPSDYAYYGVTMIIIGHALSVSGLFVVAQLLEGRAGTSQLGAVGGLWNSAPRTSFAIFLLGLATLGMPGLANFIGEFFLLLAAFQLNPWLAGVASLGMVFSAVYTLRFLRMLLFGPPAGPQPVFQPLGGFLEGLLVAALLLLGWFPNLVLDKVRPAPSPASVSSPASGERP